jgi:hypothetical protein
MNAAWNFTPLIRRPAIGRDPEPGPYPSYFYRRISLCVVRLLEVSTSQEDGSHPLLLRSDATSMGKSLRFETTYWSRNVDTRLSSNAASVPRRMESLRQTAAKTWKFAFSKVFSFQISVCTSYGFYLHTHLEHYPAGYVIQLLSTVLHT